MNTETHMILHELLYMTWEDYEDFETKYGSDNNPDNYAKRSYAWNMIHNVGLFLKKKYLDENLVYDSAGPLFILVWSLWKQIIIEQILFEQLTFQKLSIQKTDGYRTFKSQ